MEIGQLSRPQGPTGLHELFSLCITPRVVDGDPQTFEVSRNPPRHDVEIHPDLVSRRGFIQQAFPVMVRFCRVCVAALPHVSPPDDHASSVTEPRWGSHIEISRKS